MLYLLLLLLFNCCCVCSFCCCCCCCCCLDICQPPQIRSCSEQRQPVRTLLAIKQTNKQKAKKKPNERAKTSQLKVNKTRQCEGGGQADGGGVARAEGNDYARPWRPCELSLPQYAAYRNHLLSNAKYQRKMHKKIPIFQAVLVFNCIVFNLKYFCTLLVYFE